MAPVQVFVDTPPPSGMPPPSEMYKGMRGEKGGKVLLTQATYAVLVGAYVTLLRNEQRYKAQRYLKEVPGEAAKHALSVTFDDAELGLWEKTAEAQEMASEHWGCKSIMEYLVVREGQGGLSKSEKARKGGKSKAGTLGEEEEEEEEEESEGEGKGKKRKRESEKETLNELNRVCRKVCPPQQSSGACKFANTHAPCRHSKRTWHLHSTRAKWTGRRSPTMARKAPAQSRLSISGYDDVMSRDHLLGTA